jgi:hypothetical protein
MPACAMAPNDAIRPTNTMTIANRFVWKQDIFQTFPVNGKNEQRKETS